MKTSDKSILWGLLLFTMFVFASCGSKSHDATSEEGDTLQLKYSSLLHIVKYPDFIYVTIDNPWSKESVLHRYVLVKKTDSLPSHLPQGTIIRTPVERAVVFTSAHCQLMSWLRAEGRLAGVADLKYILLDYVKKGVESGRIADCGDGMNPVVEKIIDIKPDLLMVSPFENSGGYGRLEDIDIPLLECADYMENSALARAEWMKFYGLLFNKSQEADSLFATVDSTYHALREMANRTTHKTSLLTEKLTGGTWYVPGGESTVGKLIADAGGTYAWENDTHSGSLAMTFETVLDKAGDSDVWLFNFYGSGLLTYDKLASEHEGYRQIKAFKTRSAWYVDTQHVPYFEEVSFHPDYLLREYIVLLHPELGLGLPKYYVPVN